MAKILIKNGRVFDGEEFFCADVLTDGETVAKIEADISDSADFVYDASGKIVSAGLVDMHVHMKVLPSERYGIQTEMSCLPFGVTAVSDAGRSRGSKEVIDALAVKNVLFINAAFAKNRADLEKIQERIERFGERVVGIKVYFDTELSSEVDISSLSEVCTFAKERGLRVMVHCANSPTPMSEILNTLGEGDILTHTFHGGVHTALEDNFESIRAAKRRGVIIDSGFAGQVHTDFAVLKAAIDGGALPDTISTDITKFSAYTRGGRYGMTMCMSIARHMGMDERDIFRAVTTSPARALGKEAEWGRLAVSRIADIAVFDYTDEGFCLADKAGHRIESDRGYRCLLTVANGQVIYRH